MLILTIERDPELPKDGRILHELAMISVSTRENRNGSVVRQCSQADLQINDNALSFTSTS